jgi:hypothetical protein
VGVVRGGSPPPPTYPVRAVEAWLELLGSVARVASGPLFLPVRRGGQVTAERISPKVVATVVQRTAHAAGLDWWRLAATACAPAW